MCIVFFFSNYRHCENKTIENPTCNKKGECLGGGLIVLKFEDYKDCLNDCKNTTNCAWFTYHEEGNFCFLFDGCKSFSTNCSKCFSGEVSCPSSDYQCNLAGMCQVGLLIATVHKRHRQEKRGGGNIAN